MSVPEPETSPLDNPELPARPAPWGNGTFPADVMRGE